MPTRPPGPAPWPAGRPRQPGPQRARPGPGWRWAGLPNGRGCAACAAGSQRQRQAGRQQGQRRLQQAAQPIIDRHDRKRCKAYRLTHQHVAWHHPQHRVARRAQGIGQRRGLDLEGGAIGSDDQQGHGRPAACEGSHMHPPYRASRTLGRGWHDCCYSTVTGCDAAPKSTTPAECCPWPSRHPYPARAPGHHACRRSLTGLHRRRPGWPVPPAKQIPPSLRNQTHEKDESGVDRQWHGRRAHA